MVRTLLCARRAVIDGRLVDGATVVCRAGRVEELPPCGPSEPVTAVVDIPGTLLPGLVDLQVNGMGGRGCEETAPDALDAVARAARAGGAVAFLPTLITASLDDLCARARRVAAWIDRGGTADGARPLGIHLEGPFLEISGAHDATRFVDPTPERVDALLDACGGHLRLVTLAPGRAGSVAATARLVAAGVTVSLGHARDSASIRACVDAGARCVTHLFNAMTPLHHRDPGVVGECLDDPRLTCCLIADGVHVHPAVLRTARRALGTARTVLVTDAADAAGMPDGDYRLSGIAVTLRDGVVRDGAGRLAGSALTMADACRNWRRFVPDADAVEITALAATNPAFLIGADDYGTIRVGGVADFTVLDDDGAICTLRV